jgi:hypothetical protein
MAERLNQILAVEKSVKSKAHSEITRLHNSCKKPGLFAGMTKVFEALEDAGEDFPPESQRVQMNATAVIKVAKRALAELFDVTATKDAGNQEAKADVVVDGKVLLEQIPATTLLFLEKQLTDLVTFAAKLPTLDPAFEWTFDEATNVWKTPPQRASRTKKTQRPIVLYDATEHHPAQTQLITEDVVVGHWTTIRHSGALPVAERDKFLERAEKLSRAVKVAREAANAQEVVRRHVGDKVLDYLFD